MIHTGQLMQFKGHFDVSESYLLRKDSDPTMQRISKTINAG